MNYIENIFICLAAPLLIAVICAKGKGKRIMLFLLSGMAACLLSSYISTFIAAVQGADLLSASLEISPLVEETLKLFPLLFYLLIFEPRKEDIADSCLMTAIGFATFENVCYLMQNGADRILYLLIRGFGTGTMHVVCAFIMLAGILRLWNRLWLRAAGTVGLLAAAITYHGVYNILVSQTGTLALIGYMIPLLTTIMTLLFQKSLHLRAHT